jgi:hypothetical protein
VLSTNTTIFILNPGASFSVYVQNSSADILLLPASSITITSLSSGPIGPTGPTGTTGFGVRNSILQYPTSSSLISATISPPTFTVITILQLTYRLIGDRWRITYRMGWQGGSNAGSGDYLIRLPSGLNFNLGASYNQTFTSAIFPGDYSTIAAAMIPAVGGIVETRNGCTSCFVVPYNSTQFRLVTQYNNALTTWSSTSYGVNNAFLSIEFEIWSTY